MSDTPATTDPRAAIDYIAVEESPEFVRLKRRHRSFVFPLALGFLVWYFTYVLLAAFAPAFMGTRISGDITIGLLFGLGQFVTTFAITMAYVAFANRRLDPLAAEIRDELERQEAGA